MISLHEFEEEGEDEQHASFIMRKTFPPQKVLSPIPPKKFHAPKQILAPDLKTYGAYGALFWAVCGENQTHMLRSEIIGTFH
jgi:hypothetical protein